MHQSTNLIVSATPPTSKPKGDLSPNGFSRLGFGDRVFPSPCTMAEKRSIDQRSPAKASKPAGDRTTPPRRPKISAASINDCGGAREKISALRQRLSDLKTWSEGVARDAHMQELLGRIAALEATVHMQRHWEALLICRFKKEEKQFVGRRY